MNKIHWVTILSFAALAVVLAVLFHEAIHALMCVAVGGEIRRFSAVHVNCACNATWKFKLVAASGSLSNLLLAAGLWPLLRQLKQRNSQLLFFVWLLFSINLMLGTGYWFASGITRTGDWMAVIEGWQPQWLYQVGLVTLGIVSLMAGVAWALHEFGNILFAKNEKPIGRAQNVVMACYATAFVVMLVIGFAQPGGPFAFPGIAGLIAVLGGLSPLLWMMQWFRADMFKLRGAKPLEIGRTIWVPVLAVTAVIIAILVTIVGQNINV